MWHCYCSCKKILISNQYWNWQNSSESYENLVGPDAQKSREVCVKFSIHLIAAGSEYVCHTTVKGCLYDLLIYQRQCNYFQASLPSKSSSKSSTKNSRNGGRFGLFRVLSSCWILEETRLLTGTPTQWDWKGWKRKVGGKYGKTKEWYGEKCRCVN